VTGHLAVFTGGSSGIARHLHPSAARIVDLDVPQPLSFAWRKDNRPPCASSVTDVQRFPDLREVSTGKP
jgi:hypothetical protein